MTITSDDLWSHSIACELGPESRMFFGSPDYDYKRTIKQLRKVPDLILESHDVKDGIWWARFTYRGFDFFIETNSHGTASTFFVNSPVCPDPILISILEQFEALGPLFYEEEG